MSTANDDSFKQQINEHLVVDVYEEPVSSELSAVSGQSHAAASSNSAKSAGKKTRAVRGKSAKSAADAASGSASVSAASSSQVATNLWIRARQSGLCVDKTSIITRWFGDEKESCCDYIIRPQGFGKTFLLDTLELLFTGQKEHFNGTTAERRWDWSKTYSVVRIDFATLIGKAPWPWILSVKENKKSWNQSCDMIVDAQEHNEIDGLGGRVYQHLFKELTKNTVLYGSCDNAFSGVVYAPDADLSSAAVSGAGVGVGAGAGADASANGDAAAVAISESGATLVQERDFVEGDENFAAMLSMASERTSILQLVQLLRRCKPNSRVLLIDNIDAPLLEALDDFELYNYRSTFLNAFLSVLERFRSVFRHIVVTATLPVTQFRPPVDMQESAKQYQSQGQSQGPYQGAEIRHDTKKPKDSPSAVAGGSGVGMGAGAGNSSSSGTGGSSSNSSANSASSADIGVGSAHRMARNSRKALDISSEFCYSRKAATLCGITTDEISSKLKKQLIHAVEVLNKITTAVGGSTSYDAESVLQKLKELYGNYYFDNRTEVLNPEAVISFLRYPNLGFADFWTEKYSLHLPYMGFSGGSTVADMFATFTNLFAGKMMQRDIMQILNLPYQIAPKLPDITVYDISRAKKLMVDLGLSDFSLLGSLALRNSSAGSAFPPLPVPVLQNIFAELSANSEDHHDGSDSDSASAGGHAAASSSSSDLDGASNSKSKMPDGKPPRIMPLGMNLPFGINPKDAAHGSHGAEAGAEDDGCGDGWGEDDSIPEELLQVSIEEEDSRRRNKRPSAQKRRREMRNLVNRHHTERAQFRATSEAQDAVITGIIRMLPEDEAKLNLMRGPSAAATTAILSEVKEAAADQRIPSSRLITSVSQIQQMRDVVDGTNNEQLKDADLEQLLRPESPEDEDINSVTTAFLSIVKKNKDEFLDGLNINFKPLGDLEKGSGLGSDSGMGSVMDRASLTALASVRSRARAPIPAPSLSQERPNTNAQSSASAASAASTASASASDSAAADAAKRRAVVEGLKSIKDSAPQQFPDNPSAAGMAAVLMKALSQGGLGSHGGASSSSSSGSFGGSSGDSGAMTDEEMEQQIKSLQERRQQFMARMHLHALAHALQSKITLLADLPPQDVLVRYGFGVVSVMQLLYAFGYIGWDKLASLNPRRRNDYAERHRLLYFVNEESRNGLKMQILRQFFSADSGMEYLERSRQLQEQQAQAPEAGKDSAKPRVSKADLRDKLRARIHASLSMRMFGLSEEEANAKAQAFMKKERDAEDQAAAEIAEAGESAIKNKSIRKNITRGDSINSLKQAIAELPPLEQISVIDKDFVRKVLHDLDPTYVVALVQKILLALRVRSVAELDENLISNAVCLWLQMHIKADEWSKNNIMVSSKAIASKLEHQRTEEALMHAQSLGFDLEASDLRYFPEFFINEHHNLSIMFRHQQAVVLEFVTVNHGDEVQDALEVAVKRLQNVSYPLDGSFGMEGYLAFGAKPLKVAVVCHFDKNLKCHVVCASYLKTRTVHYHF